MVVARQASMTDTPVSRRSMIPFAWLSIAAAATTIVLKLAAWWITGSVGLLSDALESIVNLVAGFVALAALTIAAREPDEERPHGYDKAEYFASGTEGALILAASLAIGVTAVARLLAPQPIEAVGPGTLVSVVASLINLAVARVLIRAGRQHDSITLEADGHHLMTDVWTSAGVIAGVWAATATGWHWIDPLLALAVGLNIVRIGWALIRRSVAGLMDTALPAAERVLLQEILDRHAGTGIAFHALRTRASGARRFISVHVLVPGAWSVRRGHDLLEHIESDLRVALPNVHVITHLEPIEDPRSLTDVP